MAEKRCEEELKFEKKKLEEARKQEELQNESKKLEIELELEKLRLQNRNGSGSTEGYKLQSSLNLKHEWMCRSCCHLLIRKQTM